MMMIVKKTRRETNRQTDRQTDRDGDRVERVSVTERKVKVKVIPCRGTEARKGAGTKSGKSGTGELSHWRQRVSIRSACWLHPTPTLTYHVVGMHHLYAN